MRRPQLTIAVVKFYINAFQCTKKLRATFKKYNFYPILEFYFESKIGFVVCLFSILETGPHYIVLDDLELTTYTRMASNSEIHLFLPA